MCSLPPTPTCKGGIGYIHFSGGNSTIYSSPLIRKGENGYIANVSGEIWLWLG